MEVEVFRPKQFYDMAREYILLADGKEVAAIKRGVSQTISLPDDTRVLQAKIDWCSSAEFHISELGSPQITVKNTFASNFLKALFLPLYYMSIGKNRYLTVESGIKQNN